MTADNWRLIWTATSTTIGISTVLLTHSVWLTVSAVLVFNLGALVGGCYATAKAYPA